MDPDSAADSAFQPAQAEQHAECVGRADSLTPESHTLVRVKEGLSEKDRD